MTGVQTCALPIFICLKGGPFNLNILCRPTGGIYWGSAAILGDQFNPISANIGTNLLYHGFLNGADTTTCCLFTITVADTVYPAGIINGAGEACRGTSERYIIPPVANATGYLWKFTGSPMADTITSSPAITLLFDNSFSPGMLNARGINNLCTEQGIPSDDFYINILGVPLPAIRNAGDTVSLEDNVCKGARVKYYTIEDYKEQLWQVQNGKINGDNNSRVVTIDWGTAPGIGTLTVTVVNENGCSGSVIRHANIGNGTSPHPSEIWLFGYNMLVCSDSTVNSYQW